MSDSSVTRPYRSILFVLGNTVSDFRVKLAARHMARRGYETRVTQSFSAYEIAINDLFVFSRPGIEMCPMVMGAVGAGKPAIIDIDDDFTSIPPDNPAYKYIGPGRPEYLSMLKNTISAATAITVTQDLIAQAYHRYGEVIPNSWDEENDLWQSPRNPYKGITIGWAGTDTHRKDFELVVPALLKILSERKDVKIVIGGDYGIYQHFEHIPENQKQFLFGVPYEVYPSMYTWMDILVAPLENTKFNLHKSWIKLLEAGARGIPWVASAVPQYTEWREGGVYAGDDPMSWYGHLMALIDDGEVRQLLGEQGHAKAMEFTSAKVGEKWEKLIEEILA